MNSTLLAYAFAMILSILIALLLSSCKTTPECSRYKVELQQMDCTAKKCMPAKVAPTYFYREVCL